MIHDKIEKKVLQHIYLRPHIHEVMNILTYGHTCYTQDDIFDAFDKAQKRYILEQDYVADYEAFVKATTYECGIKAESCKYDGIYKYYPLWPWQRWKMKRDGEYQPLPKEMDLYWVFLLVFIETKANVLEICEIREKIITYFT